MTSFERPLLNGVAYAQRIFPHEKEMFERQHGWIMKTMSREGAALQDEYAPVIFSQDTVSYLARMDMMSGEEDRENILRARATGKPVLTNPFRLLGSNHLGVVLTFAVYRPNLPADASVEQRVEATAGYLGGAFDVETLVENLLNKLAGNQDILVNVYDVTNASEPMAMYGSQTPDDKGGLLHVSMLDFGDPFRRHEMRCNYKQTPPLPLSAISNPVGAFVIFLLVGYIICAAWSRYDKVTEDCRKMEELKTQAEAADIAKSQFLATVSHEIRTPMNGVLGMLDMLLGTDLTMTQKDFAQTAQGCGKSLIRLINDVLDRAKFEAGRLELEAVPFDLRSLLDDVISLFPSKLKEKSIELAVFVCDDVPKLVIGDPWRFQQIVTNLVGNAVKFTERGHVFVRVSLAESSNEEANRVLNGALNGKDCKVDSTANGACNTLSGFQAADERNSWEYFKLLLSDKDLLSDELEGDKSNQVDADHVTLMISIEDTGVGIPLHAQDRVFTPFMQADSSTSRNYGGTGIGLSISKCLAELMGGQISFTSRPSIGSTFTFSAVVKRTSKDTSNDSERSLCEALPTAFKGMKAILVDGKPVRSAVTRYHLNRLGIKVQVVNNMSTGIQAFGQNGATQSREKPCMVFIEHDIWRPETDIQLLSRLHALRTNGQVHKSPKSILLVTSEADKDKYGSTFSAVMCKPIRASTIASCLQQLLQVEIPVRKDNQNRPSFLRSLLVGKNILVVDDNRVNLRVAQAALKKYGAKVHCVESGKDAISLLQPPHCFDACFMDVQMPEMDGFEATRQIREMEKKVNDEKREQSTSMEGSTFVEWHTPVLAMTADVIQATYDKCINSGMDGYVSKPFDEQQLYQAVSRLVVGTTDTAS
ncbi:unnamed protein product [Alopecurus aequalis]